MSFGSKYGAIFGDATCGNCNAKAKIRGNTESKNDLIVLRVVCSKCRHTEFYGFTSMESLVYDEQKKRLERLLDKADNPRDRERVLRKVAELEQKSARSKQGL